MSVIRGSNLAGRESKHPAYRPLDLEIFGECATRLENIAYQKDQSPATTSSTQALAKHPTATTPSLAATKKRSHHDSSSKSKATRPNKKQKKQPAYQSESEDESSFKPVNLMDSDDEVGLDAVVDAGNFSGSDANSQSDSESEDESSARQKLGKPKKNTSKTQKRKLAQDAPPSSDDEEEGDGSGGDSGDDDDDADSFDLEGSDGDESALAGGKKSKSKRNDPAAFATSLQKILGTKLSSARRSDPVLSRSVDAQKASKEIIDAALEAKARKQMRAQKLAAQEKGRVKDVIIGPRNNATGELELSTGEIREKEKHLRRAATRGVKEVFNAFLRAQQAGMDAESQAKRDGFTGVEGRKEKVSEMSRKGFLDLIANGGGKLKKGGIEEA